MTKKFDFSVLSLKQQHETMAKLLRSEQEMLWIDLMREIKNAYGVWSIACESKVDRILACAMLVGPLPWKILPWEAVAGGLWANLWYAAELVNAPTSIPIEEIDAVEDQMSHGGMLEKKTIDYLHKHYQPSRKKMINYVIKRREAGDFNVGHKPNPAPVPVDKPECTCAMTEASFFACEVHGENAKEDPYIPPDDKVEETVDAIWPEKKGLKTLAKGENVKMVHCTCNGSKSVQVVAACPLHGVDWGPF